MEIVKKMQHKIPKSVNIITNRMSAKTYNQPDCSKIFFVYFLQFYDNTEILFLYIFAKIGLLVNRRQKINLNINTRL